MKSTKIKMYELLLETVFKKLKAKIEPLELDTMLLSERTSGIICKLNGVEEPISLNLILEYKGDDNQIIDMNLILNTPNKNITKRHRFHCANIMGISDIEYITGEIADMVYYEEKVV